MTIAELADLLGPSRQNLTNKIPHNHFQKKSIVS